MKALKEYTVPFTGLKVGRHELEFTLGDTFFESFDYSEIEKANIAVHVDLDKQPSMMVLDIHLKGSVQLPCDRCGDLIDQPVNGRYRLIVKFGQETGGTDDEILVLGPQEFEIELGHFFYEYAHLSLPSRRTHLEMADCNQDVLSALEKYKVDDNAENKWIALKDMHLDEPSENDYFEDEEE